MKGVKFGDFHSYNDFSLILKEKEIESPKPKTETIEIPGADGVLDYTEYFGEIKYNNRKITLIFSTIERQSEFLNLFSEIQNEIHGRKMNIVLDDDPEFYYVGRITLDKWKAEKNIGQITIECDCEPYKYRKYKTIIVNTITDSATLIFNNLRKNVVPTITSTAAVTIGFGDKTISISAGTYTYPDIVFTMGQNVLTVTGSTTLTVEYQEGGL